MSDHWKFEGRPTTPDVEKIMAAFADVKEGTLLEYPKIENAIQEQKESSRFKTVMNSYRRRMFREKNILFAAIPNVGIMVQNGSQRTSFSSKAISGGLRKITRGGTVALKTPTDGLDEQERRTRDHCITIAASFRQIASVEAQKLRWNINAKPEIEKK